jgi:hypothetical protein
VCGLMLSVRGRPFFAATGAFGQIELPRAASLAGGTLSRAASETDSEIGKSAALVPCSVDDADNTFHLNA